MPEGPHIDPDAKSPEQLPVMFVEEFEIPAARSQTALGIKHDTKTIKVAVTFMLVSRQGNTARYSAVCPRCHSGIIEAAATLNPDGSFAEPPACPSLCEACEDHLDAILEGHATAKPTYETLNRVTLMRRKMPLKRS
jgi:hypothetical protein